MNLNQLLRRSALAAMIVSNAAPALAQAELPPLPEVVTFKQAVAEAASDNDVLASFYRDAGYDALWTDDAEDDRARLEAFADALAEAGAHALPMVSYRTETLRAILGDVRTEADRARAEAELSELYLAYARDLQSGVLEPDEIDAGIKRSAPRRDPSALLTELQEGEPARVMRALVPQSPEYARLMRARLEFERLINSGGWGAPAASRRLDPGDRGVDVIALRGRLARMGYLDSDSGELYDASLEQAVRTFQEDHGLLVDGIAGPQTLEELNTTAQARLGQIVVAMERERWMNFDRGARHVWVNLADFRASIIDDGKTTFSTRVVVGATPLDQRSPEFSDEMEHMVVNPTWHVPRSIAVNEYLPAFRNNPNAHGQLEIHYQGQVIARERINWPAVTRENWPFALKQPPSRSNALGLVKFMFPNRWNIYLHDTPAKSLFDRNTRAFSHGCIRLQEPFEFAYALLARQTDDPQALFQSRLDSRVENTLPLEQHVPVHLVYSTALTTPQGEILFRPDVYGRDAKILGALQDVGVEIGERRS